MNLTRIISLLVIAFVAFSCSSDDDGDGAYNYNKNNLTGTYSVSAYETKEVKTVDVDGFDVVTTIVSTGDTFDVSVTFDSNDTRTMNGTYRINEVKTQGGQRSESARIVVVENDKKTYSVNTSASEITIGNTTYKVSGFGRTGFKINMEERTDKPNGDSTVYTEEWVFKK